MAASDDSPSVRHDPLTVGSLRAALEGLPDDMPVNVAYDCGFAIRDSAFTDVGEHRSTKVLTFWIDIDAG